MQWQDVKKNEETSTGVIQVSIVTGRWARGGRTDGLCSEKWDLGGMLRTAPIVYETVNQATTSVWLLLWFCILSFNFCCASVHFMAPFVCVCKYVLYVRDEKKKIFITKTYIYHSLSARRGFLWRRVGSRRHDVNCMWKMKLSYSYG